MRPREKLRTRLSTRGLPRLLAGVKRGQAGLPSVEELVADGYDPVHATYIVVQNLVSMFAEEVSLLPELKKYARIVCRAEDAYMPQGPPISPLTGSYFTTWAFFDLRFDGDDTLGSCCLAASDLLGLKPGQVDALRNFTASRMGVYEHLGADGRHVRLRELITEEEYTCHCCSGYGGRPGELWYARLLPPLPDCARPGIVFTTPYVLLASRRDWLEFLRRGTAQRGFADGPSGLSRFLKHGPDPNYWNEFLFLAYHHQNGAIFLAGIPDRRSTLPHA